MVAAPPPVEDKYDTSIEQSVVAESIVKSPGPIQDERNTSLQRLVDKYQDKTEKEISRTLKVSTYDGLKTVFVLRPVIESRQLSMINEWRRDFQN